MSNFSQPYKALYHGEFPPFELNFARCKLLKVSEYCLKKSSPFVTRKCILDFFEILET